ncbi:MAG: UbiD family decarboxylase, partial [Dehalococcoidia bacterium]|nr:UbiD family decarboxylase [Dehalococcoidia bacterium]
MIGYKDLRQHLKDLEEQNLVIRVDREINKDTELHPLVRWQFRGGIPEDQRKAFMFTNVVDSKGRKYDIPVVVGAYAASERIYSLGLGCQPEEILSRWEYALSHPVEPVMVQDGPVQEVVRTGDELAKLGLEEFPVPISTPGFDSGPFLTCANWITKDPETGIRNMGNYRAHVKSPTRLGARFDERQDALVHWGLCRDKGIPLQAAVVLGAPHPVACAAVVKVPYGTDELSVAGGLAGTPIRLVKCKTVDIEVPADAEIVIEGIIPTEYLEAEGPFGESHGYMDPRAYVPYFETTAITYRKNPIYTSWLSQMTPSESSLIKRRGLQTTVYRYLKIERGIRSVTRVLMHEPLTNLYKFIIVQMKDPPQDQVWMALYSAMTFSWRMGKIVIAVDEDIDPENLDAVMWAMACRMNPVNDVAVVGGRNKG